MYDLDGLTVKSRKVSSLGTRPLELHPVQGWEGEEQILAVGLTERMSVLFGSKDRVDFSAVSRKVSHLEAELTLGCDSRDIRQDCSGTGSCARYKHRSGHYQGQLAQEALGADARFEGKVGDQVGAPRGGLGCWLRHSVHEQRDGRDISGGSSGAEGSCDDER